MNIIKYDIRINFRHFNELLNTIKIEPMSINNIINPSLAINILSTLTNPLLTLPTGNISIPVTTVIIKRDRIIIEDNINRVVRIDRTDVTSGNVILSYDNFDNTTAYGIELSSNYRPTKWWSLNGSFDLYSQEQTGITEFIDNPDIQNATIDDIKTSKTVVDNVVWNLRLFNNFKATKKLSFSLFTMYRGEQKGVQFVRKPMFMVNTGMRYSFLEEQRATFSFNYSDIFNTMRFEFEGVTPFPSQGQFNWESNTWNIALSYRFGGGKYRALRRKQRDNNTKQGSGGFL